MYNNTGGQTSPSKGMSVKASHKETLFFLFSFLLGVRLSFLTPTDQTKFEQIFTQSAAAFGGNKIPGK